MYASSQATHEPLFCTQPLHFEMSTHSYEGLFVGLLKVEALALEF